MRSDLSQCVTCSPMCLRAVAWSHDSCSKGRTHVADFPSRQNFHNPKVDLFIHCNAKWQVRVCQTVLFLRTGTFYRSRHAEAWFNDKACRDGLHWQAKSRGFRPYLTPEDLSHWAADRLDRSGVAAARLPQPNPPNSPQNVWRTRLSSLPCARRNKLLRVAETSPNGPTEFNTGTSVRLTKPRPKPNFQKLNLKSITWSETCVQGCS